MFENGYCTKISKKTLPSLQRKTPKKTKLHNNCVINEWSSKGCELCFSGFMGRTAVYEYIDQSNISEILTKNTLENQSILLTFLMQE